MKRLFLISSFCLTIINTYCYNNNDSYNNSETIINESILTSTKWGPFDGDLGFYFYFNKNNVLKIQLIGEGNINITGKYAIISLKELTTEIEPNQKDLKFLPKELQEIKLSWKINKDSNNIFLVDFLESENGYKVWALKSEPKENTIRIVDGIKVVKLIRQERELNDNSKIRKGPSQNYDYYQFKYYDEDENLLKIDYLKKGRRIKILGRSENKDTIYNVTDYWYYIKININPYVEKGNEYGWVFGSLLKK